MAGYRDIVGHKQIIEHLKRAVSMNKISHAYIFNGEKDSGKRMIAEAFASPTPGIVISSSLDAVLIFTFPENWV